MKFEDMSEAAKAAANADWHTGLLGENLGCLLASSYEDDPDKPEGQQPDEERGGFTPWAIERANEACQRITDAAIAVHSRGNSLTLSAYLSALSSLIDYAAGAWRPEDGEFSPDLHEAVEACEKLHAGLSANGSA